MLDPDALRGILRETANEADYADVRVQRVSEAEVAVRAESFDLHLHDFERATFRAVAGGYGAASTDRPELPGLRGLAAVAVRGAKASGGGLRLRPVEVEEGEVEHPEGREFEVNSAVELLRQVKGALERRLVGLRGRVEAVASHAKSDSLLVTSEGTCVREKTPTTDLALYVVVKGVRQGFAGRILGGRGGLEVLEEQRLEAVVEELAARAKDASRAGALPGDLALKRLRVVLDSEAAGALAHEVAHLLEADVHQRSLFRGFTLPRDFELVDDPTLEWGYGSFRWDDEGVRGAPRTLLSAGGVGLLHTRITAHATGGRPGNAHGATHMPRPMASNVYVKASDWRLEEMLEDARRGIYAAGVVRAEADTATGLIELQPEIAYVFEGRELKSPIRNLRIALRVEDLGRISAIGRDVSFRPSVEKGFGVSEGAPPIRIDGALCR